MKGEHHDGVEHDWRDDPDDGSKTLDELSREEMLRALAGLDERLDANGEGAYSLLARGMLYSAGMAQFHRIIGDLLDDLLDVARIETGDPARFRA